MEIVSIWVIIIIWTFRLEQYYDIANVCLVFLIVLTIYKFTKKDNEDNKSKKYLTKDNKENKKIDYQKQLQNYNTDNFDNIETHVETDRYVERKSHEIVAQIDSISTNKAYRQDRVGMTKGERLVNEILKEEDFLFEREYRFKEVYKGIAMSKYAYDFVIFSTTGKIIAVIEYHGEQHYNYVAIYQQTLNDLTKQKETDKLKKEFIVSQGITYIEIPYYWGLDKEKISNYINLQTIKRYT